MANIILLDPDLKHAQDQKKLFQELYESHNIDHFTNLADFKKKYFDSIRIDEILIDKIDLVIFKIELAEGDVSKWISEVTELCKSKNYIDNPKSLKFIALKYEDDGVDITSLMHPNIYDVIFVPLDRLIYLQKMELIIKMPKKTTPSFLFSEKVEQEIEISKRAFIERISSIGFSLKNPIQLQNGTLSRIYVRISKSKTLGIYAKVTNSKYLENEKAYLIDFLYYGLNREQFKIINLYLKEQGHTEDLLENDDNKATQALSAKTSPDLRKKKYVLVIDNIQTGKVLSENIEKSIKFTESAVEDNYIAFAEKYLTDKVSRPILLSTPEDIPTKTVTFDIDLIEQKLLKLNTVFKANQKFLSFDPNQFFSKDKSWKNIFNTDSSRAEIQKTLSTIGPNEKVKKIMTVDTGDYEGRDILAEFMMVGESTVRITIKPMLNTQAPQSKPKSDKIEILKKVDVIVVNKKMIPEDEALWIAKVNETFDKNGLCKIKDGGLKFIIINPDDQNPSTQSQTDKLLKISNLYNYFQGSSPKHVLLYSISEALGAKVSKYNPDNICWLVKKNTCYIAKKAILNSVSEFGASITSKTPVQPGAVLFLHGYIFEQAPNAVLAARFYNFDELKDKDNNKTYTSYFTYFGINDSFLKYARKWIKDNYAAQKEQQG